MGFKKLLVVMGFIYGAGLVGCTMSPMDHSDPDHIIGNPTKSISALSTPDEGEAQNIVIFDKTVRRIHQFDITNMEHVRSFAVRNPGDEHFVLYGQNGNYIVDMSLKGLSIFNRYSQVNQPPIKLQGLPISTAFLPSKGLLIVYDELMSVGMLKLDSNGEVLKYWLAPASIQGIPGTIAAGDLNADGKLVLGMSDGSVVVADPEQSMTQQNWVNEAPIATSLVNIKWLAPLPLTPSQVMIRSSDKIALFDLTTKTIISSYDVEDEIMKISKFIDPHIILKTSDSVKVIFAKNSKIEEKVFYFHSKKFEMNYLMSSNLDLANDTWSFVDTKEQVYYFFNDLDVAKKNRRFIRYRFNNPVVTQSMNVADDTQVEIATSFIFALYPSELGYAVRQNITDESTSELKLFNLKYIPAN